MERAAMNKDLGVLASPLNNQVLPSGANSHAAPSLRTEKRQVYAKEEDHVETEARKLRNARRKEQMERASNSRKP